VVLVFKPPIHPPLVCILDPTLLCWLPLPARGQLRQLLGSLAPSLQRAPPQGWYFLRPRPLSTGDIWISLPRRPRLLLEERLRLRSILTFYNAGLRQRSLHGRRLGLWLGAGADSSAAGAESSSVIARLGSSSSQVKSVDFLHSTQLVVNQVRLPN
jgi:hypothetical protein